MLVNALPSNGGEESDKVSVDCDDESSSKQKESRVLLQARDHIHIRWKGTF
jgi:hypothetical protein